MLSCPTSTEESVQGCEQVRVFATQIQRHMVTKTLSFSYVRMSLPYSWSVNLKSKLCKMAAQMVHWTSRAHYTTHSRTESNICSHSSIQAWYVPGRRVCICPFCSGVPILWNKDSICCAKEIRVQWILLALLWVCQCANLSTSQIQTGFITGWRIGKTSHITSLSAFGRKRTSPTTA